MHRVLNDEPTTNDTLGRRLLARALARIVSDCQTPFVVGVFGTWGTGKTTFLKLIESEFEGQDCVAVWFNAWQHDQDATPAVSLLHAMVDALNLGSEFKNAMAQVAVAFGSVLLQKTTTLTLDNLEKVQALLDQEAFRVRDARSKLRTHFADTVQKARRGNKSRIIFFVDDLDRCSPQTVLRILESIKLYFNLEGCVFFLGLDRDSIERSLSAAANVAPLGEANYMDKLIQLPFSLPPLVDVVFCEYLKAILPGELVSCLPLIQAGIERNPRSAKRFVNDLMLRHQLALTLGLHSYDPRVLTLLLLFEHLQPPLFKRLAARPELLRELRTDLDRAHKEVQSARLLDALSISYVPQFASVASYLALTNLDATGSFTRDSPIDAVEMGVILKGHRLWMRSLGRLGKRLDLSGAEMDRLDLSRQILREALLQSTWLTNCDLRNADLRRANMAGAHLSYSNFEQALLRDVDLREADLRGADLRRCDLRGADLRGANLRSADLRGVIGFTLQQLLESNSDINTKLPIGFNNQIAKVRNAEKL